MAGVRADDRESHRERRGQRAATADRTQRRDDDAIQSTIRLVEEPAVPLSRKAHLEADGVGLTVDVAHALEHLAADQAVLSDGNGRGNTGGRWCSPRHDI